MGRQTPEQRAAVAERREAQQERRAEIMRMKREGQTFEQIGAAFGITKQTAHKTYVKALKERPALEIDEYRAEQLERFDDELRRCHEILERRHVVVSNGRVVCGDDGRPLEDDDVALRVLEQIRKIETDRRQLLGLNAATKADISAGVEINYSIRGVDADKL